MDAKDIFAVDKDGESVIVGDLVRRGRARYVVADIYWDVSGDGYYTETVTLACKNVRTGKIVLFEDKDVLLCDPILRPASVATDRENAT
jgi:hypothetical protein